MDQRFNVVSWNCNYFSNVKSHYLRSFLHTHNPDLIFIQEHKLLNQNISRLNIFPDYSCIASPAFDPGHGRPSGGTAILFRKDISKYVCTSNPVNHRLQSISLFNASFRLINCHLPCDSNSPHASDQLISALDELSSILSDSDSPITMIGGDFNADFNRNSAHTNYIDQFFRSISFSSSYTFCTSDDYSFHRNNFSSRSMIDHFYLKGSSFDSFHIVYDPSNPSDHNIISATLAVPSFNYHSSNSHSPVQYVIDKTRQPDLLESTEPAFSSL